ncbi:MAG: 2-dehydropantoate 2-reductase [Rhodospirillaceae bacterium]|nr:2-dehydropantoate 2-reductase [Rhodospirillaceae bacterium]MBT7509179.1 2-dehydropantoate 2-reductase [Rhodospirillaceae bacterium]
MTDKIAIVGAGALGGHVGAYLTKAGHDITLIDPWPEHVNHMKAHGLTLEGATEPECFTVPVKAIHITELQRAAMDGLFDFAFVAMKSYDTVWATQMIAQYLKPEGFCISLQNGINEERMASVVGWGKTVGCIAAKIAVEIFEPGLVRRNVQLGGAAHTVFRIGEPHGRTTARAEKIAEMISCADSAKVTNNLWGERWSKLVVNCMRNPVSAASGLGGNANDTDPNIRRLAIRLAGEAVEVGLALGYELEETYKMDPMDLMNAMRGDADAMAKCGQTILDNTSTRNNDQRPSMGQDMIKGRRTEIDYLNGLIADKARELGIAVPANDGIVTAVRRIERGEIEPSPEALAGF